ncbi:MAG TPA: hypothetical protein VF812_05630 [Ktedonobacterales bacterium]
MTMDAETSDLDPASSVALAQIIQSDAVGQLRRRDGEMARLGSEGDTLKLDWVEAIPWLLAHPDALATVEDEAQALVARGVRQVIWAGMGGSVLTVRVLKALGYGDGPLTICPLDSTDPAALNAIIRALAAVKSIDLPSGDLLAHPDLLRALLGDVALIAVAMGMTSEEPISHLAWLSEALTAAGLPLSDHLRAMSLPDSYLDTYASKRGIPRTPLQLDGGSGTGGRMSAPGTRVFLLPVALSLAAHGASAGALARILRRAWTAYDLDGAQADPANHRFVRLAAALSGASVDGAVQLYLSAPGAWGVLRDWTEQLMEESLGKGGRGVVVLSDAARVPDAEGEPGALWLRITSGANTMDEEPESADAFTLHEPLIDAPDAEERLAGLAALFLGLQLSMALYGFLHGITFAGQPAVEDYKARARALRDSGEDPLSTPTGATSVTDGRLTILAPESLIAGAPERTPDGVLRDALRSLLEMAPLPYLDLTINGEASEEGLRRVEERLRLLAVERLRVAYKLRRAPAAYHSTEQSEMDGPPALLSLRTLALKQEPSLLGSYTPVFLRAQAVATWQAMTGVGRACLLLLYDGEMSKMLGALTDLLTTMASEMEDIQTL